MHTSVAIELEKDQAFALFDFLCRYAYQGELRVVSENEREVLVGLCHALDDELIERFRSEYLKIGGRKSP